MINSNEPAACLAVKLSFSLPIFKICSDLPMLKSISTICLLACLLSACVTKRYQDSPLASDLEEVNKRIAELESSLPSSLAESCASIALDISKEQAELRKVEEEKRIKKIQRACAVNSKKDTSSKKNSVAQQGLDGKFLLGAVEAVKLIEEDRVFEARIDTGAVTSSMGVYNWKNFERDGKKWVKFSLDDDENAVIYQYPVTGTINIKQSETVTEERIEIKVDIEVGGKEYKNQLFNIADRSHLNYQLLIGRSFLRDIAVVDVARKNLLRGN